MRLRDRGRTVVFGALEDDDFDPELLRRARAIVGNGSDYVKINGDYRT